MKSPLNGNSTECVVSSSYILLTKDTIFITFPDVKVFNVRPFMT
jgi:hypothetical protein